MHGLQYMLLSFLMVTVCLGQGYDDDINNILKNTQRAKAAFMDEAQHLYAGLQNKQLTAINSATLESDKKPVTEPEQQQKAVPPLVIFVSFSMPDLSLKTWIKTARSLQAPVVIRGLIHNSFKETIAKLKVLNQEAIGGVSLNPIAFDQFGIRQVPAIVVVDKSLSLSPQQKADEAIFDVVYGDVTLDFALRQMIEKGNTRQMAQQLLEKLASEQHV